MIRNFLKILILLISACAILSAGNIQPDTGWEYFQSQFQGFYMFESITVNGEKAVALEKYEEALAKLDESLSLHLLNSAAHTLRIDVLYNLKRYEEAWRAVQKAQEGKIVVPKGSLDRLAKVFPEPEKIP